jgi:hypothetical protein
LTEISAADKWRKPKDDSTLYLLLDLDGEILEMGQGYWVEIHATRIPPTPEKPHGIDYSLCLFDPKDRCLVRYDNAHPIRVNARSRKRTTTSDHVHRRKEVKPYSYSNAETLVSDFWTDVERILKKRGIP